MSGDDDTESPLGSGRAITKLPARDLDRARHFYRTRLGLEPIEERVGGLRYVCGGTEFHVFQSSGSASGESTQMAFEFGDLEGTMRHLRARGVVFETFEAAGLPMTDGVAVVTGNFPSKGTGELGAWFRDSERNLVSLGQATSATSS